MSRDTRMLVVVQVLGSSGTGEAKLLPHCLQSAGCAGHAMTLAPVYHEPVYCATGSSSLARMRVRMPLRMHACRPYVDPPYNGGPRRRHMVYIYSYEE